MVEITLGENITVAGPGVTVDSVIVDGNIVTITAAGAYRLRGALDDGQIIVDTQDEEDVELILDGVDITCSTSAPIYVSNAKDTVIILADDSENYVTDGESYVFEDAESDEPNAAIFSHDDLVIRGNGALIVQAKYNNGIQSKDDLRIKGGNLTVHAVNDGIKGKDSLTIREANVIVEAGGDGMQSNEDADPEKGVVSLDNSTVTIVAGEDGIQAEMSLSVSGGYIAISSGGGSANSSKGENWGNWGTRNDPNSADTLGSAKGTEGRRRPDRRRNDHSHRLFGRCHALQ